MAFFLFSLSYTRISELSADSEEQGTVLSVTRKGLTFRFYNPAITDSTFLLSTSHLLGISSFIPAH